MSGISEECEGSFCLGDFFLDRDGTTEGVMIGFGIDWSGETDGRETGWENLVRGEGSKCRRRSEESSRRVRLELTNI